MTVPETRVLGPEEFGFDGELLPAVLEMWLQETNVFSLFEETLASLNDNSNELSALSRNLGHFRKLSSIFDKENCGCSKEGFRTLLKRVLPYKKILQEAGASLGVSLLSEKTVTRKIKEEFIALAREYNPLILPKSKIWSGEVSFDAGGCRLLGNNTYFASSYLSRFFAGRLLHDDELEYRKAEKETSAAPGFRKPAVVYIMTIGPGIDEACERFMGAKDTFKAYLLNSLGAGAVESAAADLCRHFTAALSKDHPGKEFRRISPGYADFELGEQRKIFSLLVPEEDIGVRLNEGNIMVPEKTTSGIMSVKEE
jgi:hypothetical protein